MDEIEAILYLERGPQPNLRFPLQQDQVIIGRGAGNDLVLVDPEVSRRHARIVRQPHQFAVEDLGSTNGTFVNGQRVSSLTALHDADTIDLGDTIRLRFVITSPSPLTVEQPAAQPTPKPPVPVAESPAPNKPTPRPPVVVGIKSRIGRIALPTCTCYQLCSAELRAAGIHGSTGRRGRGLWLGCGLFLALLLVCLGTFLLLDAFDQGRLLYCGPVRPIFEVILGPFGFDPIC